MKPDLDAPSTRALLLVTTLLLMGCDSRSLTLDSGGELSADASIQQGDRGPILKPDLRTPDTVPPDPCAPMDTRQDPASPCKSAGPIGWFWDGQLCEPLYCSCLGADCETLYESEARCLEMRASACLPAPECLELEYEYEACEERPDCQITYYGGGCIDFDVCEPSDSDSAGLLCYERGVACVPMNHPCNTYNHRDCQGECYWWGLTDHFCFGETGNAECCVSESYGFCAPLPTR